MSTELLSLHDIVKRFPGVIALDRVSLEVSAGSVHCVVGENGAGKSTLMKILAGIQAPDSGQIRLDGKEVTIGNVRTATDHGIALIHQELNLADNLDVGANIFLGREPRKFGMIDRAAIRSLSQPVIDRLAIDCSPDMPLSQLSIGRRQLVEIAKALSIGARILIMDEPTSSLSHAESQRLLQVIRELCGQGVSIIYVTHRLREVMELADKVTVLRDGQLAGELLKNDISHHEMVRLMVGRELGSFYPEKRNQTAGSVCLAVKDLRTEAFPDQQISFNVAAGEIVGLAGLVGSGRSELVETIFGAQRAVGGHVVVCGNALPAHHRPQHAISAGLVLAPEDRKQQGLFVDDTVRRNINVTRVGLDSVAGMVNRKSEADLAARMVDEMQIKTPGVHQHARFLSGGNQQKIVLAKWLALDPDVLILDEPTRGIDVGAREQIYRDMDMLARKGVAVVFVSSDLEELIGMADRVLVFHEGRLAGQLSGSEVTEEAIMTLATGAELARAG